MLRVGDTFKPTAGSNFASSVLVSDVAIHYGGHPQKQRYTNHHEFDPTYDTHDHWYFKNAFRSPTNVYPAIDANYGDQDGSVRRWKIPAFNTENFSVVDHQLVPDDYVEFLD